MPGACYGRDLQGLAEYSASRPSRQTRSEKFFCSTEQKMFLAKPSPAFRAGLAGRSGPRLSRDGCEPGSRKFVCDGKRIIRDQARGGTCRALRRTRRARRVAKPGPNGRFCRIASRSVLCFATCDGKKTSAWTSPIAGLATAFKLSPLSH
jgi:hypothetical protein